MSKDYSMYRSTRLRKKIQPKSRNANKEDTIMYDILCITKNIENDLNIIITNQKGLINNLKTEIEELSIQNSILERVVEEQEINERIQYLNILQRDDAMASMYNEIMVKEEQLFTLSDKLNKKKEGEESFICMCCFDDISHSSNSPITCTDGHVFCISCIDKFCCLNLNNIGHEPNDNIKCLSHLECDHTIDKYQLIRCEYGTKLLQNYWFYQCKDMISEMIKHCNDKEDLLKQLAFVNFDGSMNAYQCHFCGFGPMLNANCSDLRAHHGQQTDSGTIDNSCPNCKALVLYTTQMERWNPKNDISN